MNGWIKKTNKHIRHKIYHSFKFNTKTKTRSPFGSFFYIYEHPDKLVFQKLSYLISNGVKAFSQPSSTGVLKCKNNQFNFYVRNGSRWKNASNSHHLIYELVLRGAEKRIQIHRIESLLKKFARKHGVKIKKARGSAVQQIIRLCYPLFNELNISNNDIYHVNPKYCRTFRKKMTLRLANRFKVKHTGYPRFFDWCYMCIDDPMWIRSKSLKYIKLNANGFANIVTSSNQYWTSGGIHSELPSEGLWTEKQCNENIKNGKFIEIPPWHGVLM